MVKRVNNKSSTDSPKERRTEVVREGSTKDLFGVSCVQNKIVKKEGPSGFGKTISRCNRNT